MFSPPRWLRHFCAVAALSGLFGMQAAQAYTVTNTVQAHITGDTVISTVTDNGLVNYLGASFTVTYDTAFMSFLGVDFVAGQAGFLINQDGTVGLELAYALVNGELDVPFALNFAITGGTPGSFTTVFVDGLAFTDAGVEVPTSYQLVINIPDPNAPLPIGGTQWLVLAGLTLLPIAPITRKKHAAPALAG